MRADSSATATLDGEALFGTPNKVLGWWAMTEEYTPQSAAFGLRTMPDTQALVWRVNLPANPRLAAAQLHSGVAQLRAVDVALGQCEGRIATLVQSQAGGASFDTASVHTKFPMPEEELLHTLDAFQYMRQPVSFGLADRLDGRWQEITVACQSFIDRLVRFISHYAWVETEIEGHLVGRTVLGWDGDVNTLWYPALNKTHAALHHDALNLALGSRDRLLNAFVVASRGALLLATLPALLATPLGAVAALPAAWKFVNQVLALLDRP